MGSMGLCLACGRGRGVRPVAPPGGRDRRGRRLPAQHPGAADGRPPPAAPEDGRHRQRGPRHGPAVPAELFRRSLPVDTLGLQARPTSGAWPRRTGSRATASNAKRICRGPWPRSGRIPLPPALLHVRVDRDVNVYPKIAFGTRSRRWSRWSLRLGWSEAFTQTGRSEQPADHRQNPRQHPAPTGQGQPLGSAVVEQPVL